MPGTLLDTHLPSHQPQGTEIWSPKKTEKERRDGRMEWSWVGLGGVPPWMVMSPSLADLQLEGFASALHWCMQPGLPLSLANYWAKLSLEDGWPLPCSGGKPWPRGHAITCSSEHVPLLLAEKTCISPRPWRPSTPESHLSHHTHSSRPTKCQAQRLRVWLPPSRATKGQEHYSRLLVFQAPLLGGSFFIHSFIY